MPTKEIKTVDYQSREGVMNILNAIRNSQDMQYQERIPEATQNNIRDIGNAMMKFVPQQNAFLNALVNRIAWVIVTSRLYDNPLREFKRGTMEFGETVEEVFVNIMKAKQYNPELAETEVFKREIPDVRAAFHTLNRQNFYKATISNDQLRQAFLSYQGITDLIARIVEAMYTSNNFDEFILTKQLISEWADEGNFYAVNVPAPTKANAIDIVTTIKSYSNMLEFMSTDYNKAGVATYSDKRDGQILLMRADFDAIVDVNVLASAFNMEKAEFMGRRVLVDNFGTRDDILCCLVDREFFMIFDNFRTFTENYNGEGLYWNYFYHIWQTYSISPFAPAIMFTTDAVAVTAVDVTPKTPTIAKGAQQQFTATVTATGGASKAVKWSVVGAASASTTINDDGFLQVAADETGATLTITATSVQTPSVSGNTTATIPQA